MPVTLPILDDRNYQQILEETLRRIPVYTPEWTNFNESDPGVTIVELFAFLTESLLYRANRIPELNRLKFLQLLNVPLQSASPADGLVTIQNERGPILPLLLEQGIVLTSGNVQFITADPLNVLPVQVQAYYKRPISPNDPLYADYKAKYEAVLVARLAEARDAQALEFPGSSEVEALGITPQFYEPARLEPPKRGEPLPAFDLESTADRSLYLALLAPQNVPVADVRRAIANQVISIGIAPAVNGPVPTLQALQSGAGQPQGPGLVFEYADTSRSTTLPMARYLRLKVIQQMDVFRAPGLVMVELPAADQLISWSFDEPLEEGTGDFPPRIEDEEVRARLITWLRIRLPKPQEDQTAQGKDRRLAWVGINVARIIQAVPVFNEYLGVGNGEPDQTFVMANVPVLPATLRLVVEENGSGTSSWQPWRLIDDLLSAKPDERVYTVDAESGLIRFGDGLRGRRPRGRILVSYQYGGGPQGNVSTGAVNASPDPRLQGGYTISNPLPTSGGALGETPMEGERRIPLVVRHRDRLVTQQDFRDITRRAPGVNVGRVEVLSLFNPDHSNLKAAGTVTVMVIPRFDPLNPLWPDPERLFLQRVCSYLDPRRLVTTEIYVRGPSYVGVYVSVGIQILPGHFVDRVRRDVENSLRLYLSSLPPGGPDRTGWPLSKQLVSKDLEAVATRVPGVEYVDSLQMGVESPVSIADYDLTGLSLPKLMGVSVRQGSAESLDMVFAPVGSTPTLNKGVPIPVIKPTC